MNLKGPFSRLLAEFGSQSSRVENHAESPIDQGSLLDTQKEKVLRSRISGKDVGRAAGSGKLEVRGRVDLLADSLGKADGP
jgi:hypothetical protein